MVTIVVNQFKTADEAKKIKILVEIIKKQIAETAVYSQKGQVKET